MLSSLAFNNLPLLLKVQPWNGQVNEFLFPVLRRHNMAPRWAQLLINTCNSFFFITSDNNRLPSQRQSIIISRLGNLAFMGEKNPISFEDMFHFKIK